MENPYLNGGNIIEIMFTALPEEADIETKISILDAKTIALARLGSNVFDRISELEEKNIPASSFRERVHRGFNRIALALAFIPWLIWGVFAIAYGINDPAKVFTLVFWSSVAIYGTIYAIGWIIRGFMRP